jgi:hypothetical protein
MLVIKEIYFVLKGRDVNPFTSVSIKNDLVGPGKKIKDEKVVSGSVFRFKHSDIKSDPFPRKQKDVVVILINEDTNERLPPIRVSERDSVGRENKDREIILKIP